MLEPLSPAKCLLFLWLLATSVLTGVRLTRRFVDVREPLDVAGYGLGFSFLILGAVGSLMARITRNLPITFIALAAAMSLPLLLDFRHGSSAKAARDTARPQAILNGRQRVFAVALGALVILPPLAMIWRTDLWDDWYLYLPITSAFSRGVVPIVYPFLPDRALTYHFGFAWVAGVLEYHTGISPEHCVDIVSTALLVTFYLSAGATYRLWLGGRLGPYVAASVAIGFGPLTWLWGLFQKKVHQGDSFLWSWVLNSQATFSNEIARPADYLLQKPMLAGMALLWTLLAVFFVARRRTSIVGAGAAGICVGMSELFHYPTASLAAVAGCAVLAFDLLFGKWGQRRRLFFMLVVFGVAAAAIPRLNGGFAANPQGDAIIVDRVWNVPFPATVEFARAHGLSTLLCYVLYYGASLAILPFVLPTLWRQRAMHAVWLAAFAVVAFTIPHVFHHRTSPVNITKFFHLSAFGLASLSAAGLLVATRGWRSGLRAAVLSLYLVVVSLSTWLACYEVAIPYPPRVDSATVASLRLMARWLRAHAGTYDRVFALSDDVEAMSGVLSPLPPYAPGDRQMYTITAHGYAPEYIATVKALTDSAAASLDDASLARLKIRWVVLPNPLPATVGAEARRRLGQAELLPLRHRTTSTPGGWLIYEYLRGPTPGSLDR